MLGNFFRASAARFRDALLMRDAQCVIAWLQACKYVKSMQMMRESLPCDMCQKDIRSSPKQHV